MDDRTYAEADPVGTEADEVFFGEGFSGEYQGILAIERGVEGHIYILTAGGGLFRLRRRAADVNGDGAVNVADLLAVITSWGSCAKTCTPGEGKCFGDVAPYGDGDCNVNVADLLMVIVDWG